MLAGFLHPQAGSADILGRTVFDTERGIFLAPHTRPVRWTGQTTTLFPRMTVRGNLAFPLLTCDRKTRADRLEQALQHFNLGALAETLPHQLSGGQQQRVAVIRAAIDAPGRVLLLDEPFTGLDAEVRLQLIAQLRTWLGATPVVSVTHDVEEAFLLDADVLRMEGGRVVAQGPVREVLGPERERMLRTLEAP